MKVAALIVFVASCAGERLPDGPVLTGDEYSIQWGPLAVPPGSEGTQCVTVALGNAEAIRVHEIRNQLSSASHHLIVYRIDDPAAETNLVPIDCAPFAGALSPTAGASPLMITQKHDETLTLPDGVAFDLSKDQRIRLEMHYFNSSDDAQVAEASVTFAVGTPELIHYEASFLFIGTPDIKLAPRARTSVESFFTPPADLHGIDVFAITGHTHKFGTAVEVDLAAGRDAERRSVYAPVPFKWDEPPTERHDPPFQVPDRGGFHFRCDYENASDQLVEFGESANDEMCFFWAYYYPSRGARMCVHSAAVGGPEGIDVCCPAAPGDQLSKFVCDDLGKK